MKIPKETVDRMITGSLKEIWDTFITLEGEYPEFNDDYEVVRFGDKVMFEIQDLWEDTKQIMRKDKEGKVIILGKPYTMTDFRTEKEIRRKIMVEAITKNIAEGSVTEAR